MLHSCVVVFMIMSSCQMLYLVIASTLSMMGNMKMIMGMIKIFMGMSLKLSGGHGIASLISVGGKIHHRLKLWH